MQTTICVKSGDRAPRIVNSGVALRILLAAYDDPKIKRVSLSTNNNDLTLVAQPGTLRLTLSPAQPNDRRLADLAEPITKAQGRKKKLGVQEITRIILRHCGLPAVDAVIVGDTRFLPLSHLAALVDEALYRR